MAPTVQEEPVLTPDRNLAATVVGTTTSLLSADSRMMSVTVAVRGVTLHLFAAINLRSNLNQSRRRVFQDKSPNELSG